VILVSQSIRLTGRPNNYSMGDYSRQRPAHDPQHQEHHQPLVPLGGTTAPLLTGTTSINLAVPSGYQTLPTWLCPLS